MILLVNICNEKLHYYEFVRPIEDILKENNMKFFVRDYLKVNKRDLKKADKIIICGTSLKDSLFLNNFEKFKWLGDFKKSVLGICGGMQIIGLIFCKKEIRKKTEVGFFKENFNKDFLGLKGSQEVYHLHNYWVHFNKEFIIYNSGKIPQAVKHIKKNIYGVLFHPEVRQKGLILNFCKG